MFKISGSFRDPCGYVYNDAGRIIRTVNSTYREHWEWAVNSGLFTSLTERHLLPKFDEIAPQAGAWKTLEVEKIPWISYPYEWSFYQLRDAASLTLELQTEALKHSLSLKDASAYNVQFIGSQPIFIDLLSFEKRTPNAPWAGYRQFCMQFLSPLAMASYEPRLGRMPAGWIGGIPLNLAWKLLPWKSFFCAGLQMHIHMHGWAEQKYGDTRKAAPKVRQVKINDKALLELVGSLRRTVDSLRGPSIPGDWTDYYSNTNYSDKASAAKLQIVELAVKQTGGGLLGHDLGANTGRFSAVMAPYFEQVVASDIDAPAVGRHYLWLQQSGNTAISKKILPLVLDLSNPSPGIGWANSERMPWAARGEADFVCALALTHHLYFTEGIPWERQASFFAALLRTGGSLLLEFIPHEDSQVQRMLAARDELFADYELGGLCTSFGAYFQKVQSWSLPDSCRKLILFRKVN